MRTHAFDDLLGKRSLIEAVVAAAFGNLRMSRRVDVLEIRFQGQGLVNLSDLIVRERRTILLGECTLARFLSFLRLLARHIDSTVLLIVSRI